MEGEDTGRVADEMRAAPRPEERRPNALVQRLLDYKEFLLILVLFATGFFWLQGSFVSVDRHERDLGAAEKELRLYVDRMVAPVGQLRDEDFRQTCVDSRVWKVLSTQLRMFQVVDERLFVLAQRSGAEGAGLAAELNELRTELGDHAKEMRDLMLEAGDRNTCAR